MEQIDTAAANRLAPLVLGAPLFAQMQAQFVMVSDWDHFKKMVEAECGLSREEERSALLTMQPTAGQTDADFVLAVEAQRKLVVPHEPADNLPYIFVPRLSRAFKRKLEAARASKVLSHVGSKSLTWADVVHVAKDAKYSVKVLDDGDEVQPHGRPPST